MAMVAMGECSAYSSLPADSKVKFAAWLTSWQPPGTDRLSLRGSEWTLAIYGFLVENSTINIVQCTVIMIIIITLLLDRHQTTARELMANDKFRNLI